jgi:hypothetical protein
MSEDSKSKDKSRPWATLEPTSPTPRNMDTQLLRDFNIDAGQALADKPISGQPVSSTTKVKKS